MPKKSPQPATQPEAKAYNVNPSAVPFHNSHARVKALCGPVGSGKSLAACFELWFLCRESKIPVRALVLRESYRQLRDSTMRTWMEWFGAASTYIKGEETIRFRVENIYGQLIEHELHMRHARRVEDAQQFMSTEYGFIWLEEPVPAFERDSGIIGGGLPEGVFDICAMRQRQAGMHRLPMILTFNPPSKFHWIHKKFFGPTKEDLARKSMALFRQPRRENAKNLRPGYYEELEDILDDPEQVRRWLDGECVTMYPGERCFPQFQEQWHFAESLQPVRGVPLVLMFDFGRTPVCLIGQVLPDTQLRIYRELCMVGCGIETLADRLTGILKDHFPKLVVGRSWGDPAGADAGQTDERTCFDVLSTNGYPCQPGAVTYAARFEAVIQRAKRVVDSGQPAILISRTGAPVLTEGLLGGYRFPKAIDGQLGSRPIKNQFSHPCDALQYGCSGEYDIRSGRKRTTADGEPKQWQPKPIDPFAETRQQPSGGWMAN